MKIALQTFIITGGSDSFAEDYSIFNNTSVDLNRENNDLKNKELFQSLVESELKKLFVESDDAHTYSVYLYVFNSIVGNHINKSISKLFTKAIKSINDSNFRDSRIYLSRR